MTRIERASGAPDLGLSEDVRAQLWTELIQQVESYLRSLGAGRAADLIDTESIDRFLCRFSFEQPVDPVMALRETAAALRTHQVHTSHPRYFGLFNPRSTTMGIAADTLVAALNPQLAAWSHSPLATEIEQESIRRFGQKFGFDGMCDGTFTSGGAEANLTAVFAALASKFPVIRERGLRALPADPVLYASEESHHSLIKAARIVGLGDHAVRAVPVTQELRLDVGGLRQMIEDDTARGLKPFLVVATAGTTGTGVIDPLSDIARVAREENLWFHVDAAWGGAGMLCDELRSSFSGIEAADSITFDPHKWLSVPMGAGMFLTPHAELLHQVFGIATSYMPREEARLSMVDSYSHSLIWSRRFAGLKLFLSLAAAGWDGYADVIRKQCKLGNVLRERLAAANWRIENETLLPLVCFVDDSYRGADADRYHQRIADEIVASGEAWISTVRIKSRGRLVLRACITNYATSESDIEMLIELLAKLRKG